MPPMCFDVYDVKTSIMTINNTVRGSSPLLDPDVATCLLFKLLLRKDGPLGRYYGVLLAALVATWALMHPPSNNKQTSNSA